MSANHSVGYKKPPNATQFKKGQSGNPHGRPKGRRNLATALDKVLEERVVVNENGRRKTISKFEAAYKHLANKAASGDLTAIRLMMEMVRSTEKTASAVTAPRPAAMAQGQTMAQRLLDSVNRALAEEAEKKAKASPQEPPCQLRNAALQRH